jgi:hypothetical protein
MRSTACSHLLQRVSRSQEALACRTTARIPPWITGAAPIQLAFLLSSLVLFALPMASHATEEPDYQVVQNLGDVEVREYSAYTVADVVVPGPAAAAGNAASTRLEPPRQKIHKRPHPA